VVLYKMRDLKISARCWTTLVPYNRVIRRFQFPKGHTSRCHTTSRITVPKVSAHARNLQNNIKALALSVLLPPDPGFKIPSKDSHILLRFLNDVNVMDVNHTGHIHDSILPQTCGASNRSLRRYLYMSRRLVV
jgi:hypothetical protein